jgi:hypothetical protein
MTILGYFLMKNISVLENLQDLVTDLRLEFTGHKEENRQTRAEVEALKTKVVELEENDIEHRMKFIEIDMVIKNKNNG